MRKEYNISEFDNNGFLHSRIKDMHINLQSRIVKIELHAADLKSGEYITTCTITITDWWGFEVYEYSDEGKIINFSLDNIPELNQILHFSYTKDEIIFMGIGLHNNTAIDYKFIKPKIQITGEYDPD